MLGFAVYAIFLSSGERRPGRLEEFALGSSISLAATLLAGWLCGRWLERLPFRALGAALSVRGLGHFAIGMAVGAGSLALAVAFAAMLGNYSFEFNGTVPAEEMIKSLLGSFFVLAIAAGFEEAFFRGYMFQTLTRAGLAWLALALTAVVFGYVHLGNPGSGNISTIDTIVAGVLFGLAYLRSRDLWYPFGIHLAWNWMQGSVFGIEVSGLTELTSASIFREIDKGPDWLTGGNYGIEGGVASTAALIIATLLVYFGPLPRGADEDPMPMSEGIKASGS